MRTRRTVRVRLPKISAREGAAISYFIDQLDLDPLGSKRQYHDAAARTGGDPANPR